VSQGPGVEIFDISPEISPEIAVWPGDAAFKRTVTMDTNNGDHIGLSTMETTLHLGAHTDAPNHYKKGGEGIETRSLFNYFGPAQVISVSTSRGQRIVWEDLATQSFEAPRLLFRTQSFPDPNSWNNDFCSLSGDLVDRLAEAQVLLVGIDTPSIDLFEDKVLESHSRIGFHNMSILEGIDLTGVKDGLYHLSCLPLKLKGADASPVRAILSR